MKNMLRYLKLNLNELNYFKNDKYRKREALYTLLMSPILFFMCSLNKNVQLKSYQLSKHFTTLKNASSHDGMYMSYLKRMKG